MSDFEERSRKLATGGVYGPEQFNNDVIEVACSFWDIDRIGAALPETQVALARLNKYRRVLRRVANRLSA